MGVDPPPLAMVGDMSPKKFLRPFISISVLGYHSEDSLLLGPGIDNYNVRSLQGKVELSVECLGTQ